MKPQATRCTNEHVELHALRQRTLGERMIGDNDKPRRWDFLVTAIAVGLIIFGSMKGWW